MSEELPPPQIKRPSSFGNERMVVYTSSIRRWWESTFTWENLIAGMKTFAWVAPLTILIWVYAEREQIERVPGTTIPVSVRSSDPNRIVMLRPGDHSITATVNGPRIAVARVTEMVQAVSDVPVVQIEIGNIYEVGKWSTIDTQQHVGGNALFRSRGVTLTDCKPGALQIYVDELVERDVEVRVPSDVTNLAGPAAFEPRTVRVRGPRTKLEDPREPLIVTAALSGREEIQTPGPKDIAAVSVRPSINDPSITVTPSTVRATIDVSQREEEYLIASMPIWPSTPMGLLDKFTLECEPSISNITVIGPQDQIQRLQRGEYRPKALLEITAEDEGKPRVVRELKFDLPDRVKVVAKDKEKTKITFRLSKRD